METKQSNNSATPMSDAVKIANQRALFSLEWENDTVFKKRELNYKTKTAFQKDLEAGKISKYTTVFIKDTKEIYKNGQYYGAGSSSVANISDILKKLATAGSGGKIEQNDYNILVGYLEDKKILIATDESVFFNINCSYEKDAFINLSYQRQNGEVMFVNSFFINNDLTVNGYEQVIPSRNGDGSKFLSNDGTYKEISDTIINIGNLDNTTGTLSGITYNEIVDCIKKNGSIKVRVNMNGVDSIFTPISCMHTEEPNQVMISIDISLASYNMYNQILAFLISNDNSYVVLYVNKFIIGGTSTSNGNISIGVSYKGNAGLEEGIAGSEEISTSITLEKKGDGTKALTDNGSYKEFIPEAPTDGGVYGRKDKQWEKMVKQKVVTESEYSALGNAVNTDGVLYFVTPD